MNRVHRLVPFALALVAFTSTSGSSALWAPELNTEIAWTWRRVQELTLDEMTLRPAESISSTDGWPLENYSFEIRNQLEIVAHDQVLELTDGQPARLRRHLRKARLDTRVDLNREQEELASVSRFEGETWTHTWNGKDQTRRALPAEDSDLEEHELEGLREPLDLRGLLNGKPREAGSEWHLDHSEVHDLLRPGGKLSFTVVRDDFDGVLDNAALGWLLGAAVLDGETYAWGKAKYEGVVREGKRRLACIRLRLSIEAEGEVRDRLDALSKELGSGQSWVEISKEIQVQRELKLNGFLYWDLEAQRADSLELRGNSRINLELLLNLEPYGMLDQDWILAAEFDGSLEITVDASPVNADQ